jgi:hypothetical protein
VGCYRDSVNRLHLPAGLHRERRLVDFGHGF